MPVICIRTYEARCDGDSAQGVGSYHVIEEAKRAGWLRRGRKLYCPKCRPRYERKTT